MEKENVCEILNLETILTKYGKVLSVPEYQRPYKWESKNVLQLINDIIESSENPERNYRIGTLVLHGKDNVLYIVDGQQRLVSLTLMFNALGIEENFSLFNQAEFKNPISQKNIYYNNQTILNELERLKNIKDYLLKNCEMVVVILEDIEEAFQFFDSQNNRGKSLEPHDLLKAYHLRALEKEIADKTELQKTETAVVSEWEQVQTEEAFSNYFNQNQLSVLFKNYLYRTKRWMETDDALDFTTEDTDYFKGVDIEGSDYPYIQLAKYAHLYIKNLEQHPDNTLSFPFQLEQEIINGKRFFEMVSHYFNLKKKIDAVLKNIAQQDSEFKTCLEEYDGRVRVGDGYVRNLFECALMYVVDKFGTESKDLKSVVINLFIWAYHVRLRLVQVYIESVNNYAQNKHRLNYENDTQNIFKLIHQAKRISEVAVYRFPDCSKDRNQLQNKRLESLVKYFNKYYRTEDKNARTDSSDNQRVV